ncbi:MAG: hypothetical protein ACI9XK_001710 [Granulosicoccus sp.]|jgi:hypothetical protein
MISIRQQCLWIVVFQLLLFAGVVSSDEISEWETAWPNTDFTKHNIPLSEIESGGIPKDGIPSINRPRLESIKQARKWINENEPVMVVVSGNGARAYPLQILIYHQIVNDIFQGKPIVVTFCPLCHSGLVLSRKVGSKTLTFGSTGLLRNSGLIMFDRQTESWWQQFIGTAIVGEYTGEKLTIDFSSQLISFGQFAERYPKSKVLSRDTGFRRKYGLNPFQGYDSIDNTPMMFNDVTDPRLPPMERVLSLSLDDSLKLYPYSSINTKGVINDIVKGIPVVILSGAGYASPLDQTDISKSATVLVVAGYISQVNDTQLTFTKIDGEVFDEQTKSLWNVFGFAVSGSLKGTQLSRIDVGTHFAFAALAFTPEADVYIDTELLKSK